MRTTTDWLAIVLAAGAGSRMRSRRPKLLHEVAGRPILSWVLDALAQANIGRRIVVLGRDAETIAPIIGERATIAVQAEPHGTADAVRSAAALAAGAAQILVVNGDHPLISPVTLAALCAMHEERGATLTFLSAVLDDPAGFGRVQRGADGRPLAVVEDRDAPSELLNEREINAGVYCFRAVWLWPQLDRIQPSATTGELYLTELVRMAAKQGEAVETVAGTEDDARGINTRAELAEAESRARDRIRKQLMAEGVTLVDPSSIYIDADVHIGPDTVILPNTHITGEAEIGEDCEIGPNSIIRSSHVGDRCRILASVVEEALIEPDVRIGPFSHLRPGASIGQGAQLGNYAEVKQSRVGPGTQIHHFSYIGDAIVGKDVNIGAGTITCNFDGHDKHQTRIGDGAFIGSDTMLVAPVSVGNEGRTGAGSVVTHDVADGALVVGVPARPVKQRRETAEQA